MSKGGTAPAGSTTVTNNSSTAPWTGVQSSLENIYARANDVYNTNPLNYYPYQTLATPDSRTSSIYGNLADFGNTGSGASLSNDSINYQENALLGANSIAGGSYLNNSGLSNLSRLSTPTPVNSQLLNYGTTNNAGYNRLLDFGNPSTQDYSRLLSYGKTPDTSYADNAAASASTLGSGLGSHLDTAQDYASALGKNPYMSSAANNPYIDASNPYLKNILGASDSSIGAGENYLGNFAAGNTDPYIRGAESSMLNLGSGTNAATAAGEAALGKTANGDYLNSNPYLDQMFGSAAGNVTRAYQTATAPQTDANFEATGRYGSGALANARSQNQLDLGTTLNNLSSNIYGTNYANERQLQTTAANQLGQTGIADLNARSSDLYGLGNIGNANTSNMVAAANNTGSLGLGNLNALVNQGGTAGGLYNSSLLNAGNLYNTSVANAGNLYNTSLYGAGNLANANTANLISGFSSQGSLYNNAQSGLNNANANSIAALTGFAGAENTANANSIAGLYDYGALNNSANANAIGALNDYTSGTNNANANAINAANDYSSNYNYGVGNMLKSDLGASTLSGLPYQDALAGLYGSQGLTGLSQNTINDEMARYYGNELQNWDTLGAYANLINGGSGTGSTTSGKTTSPYYAPSTTASVLGTGLGALSLGNGLFGTGGALSSGGFLSGLFGGGGSSALFDTAGAIGGDFSGGAGLDTLGSLLFAAA